MKPTSRTLLISRDLKLLISSVGADLVRARENRKLASSMETWLMALRENLQKVEADTQEAFDKRRELVRLLVKRIAVSRTEEGRPKVDIPIGSDHLLQRVLKSVCTENGTPAG